MKLHLVDRKEGSCKVVKWPEAPEFFELPEMIPLTMLLPEDPVPPMGAPITRTKRFRRSHRIAFDEGIGVRVIWVYYAEEERT